MALETVTVTGLTPSSELDRLIADIDSAASRARKSLPGDRQDIIRFEALCTQLELLVGRSGGVDVKRIDVDLTSGSRTLFGVEPSNWEGDIPIEVLAAARSLEARGLRPIVSVDPLSPGLAAPPESISAAAGPSERWEGDGSSGTKAVEARFRGQIESAITSATRAQLPTAISPSGIQNAVVTSILREFVNSDGTTSPVVAPVEYRDGSVSANPFALRSLALREHLPAFDIELRFALLSIRHTEMDATVNGAWLRNNEISRPRKQAETDDLVYSISRAQFDVLTGGGERRVRIYLYQTGLEPAVVGFYKALTDHLMEQPRSVAVQPMFFVNRRRHKHKKSGGKTRGGERRSGKSRRKPDPKANGAPFRKGLPWTM